MKTYKEGFRPIEIERFTEYVQSFYGDGSIYEDRFKDLDINAGVVTDIEIYRAMLLLQETDHTWGGGDTLDREVTRDIMLARRTGGCTDDLEYGTWLSEQPIKFN